MRAKFILDSKTEHSNGTFQVSFRAATTGPGNEDWSKWTPAGTIEMSITNPVAAAELVPGKSYLLEFTAVE